MSIRLKLTILLILLFSASIGNAIFTFVMESHVEKKLIWVLHTHEVINQSEKLLSSMTDAETGQRGFLLTGDATYLEPYHHGLSSAEESFKILMELTADNQSQQERLSNIHLLIKEKFDELKKTISWMSDDKKQGKERAIDLVKKNIGKKYMDDIRSHLMEFNNEELMLLETRKGDFRESRAYITILIVIEIIFFIFLGIITTFFINNNLFHPLKLLLKNTSKMEKGERQKIEDILPDDEMGYLLSRFYKMSEKVYEKTELLSYRAHHDELTGLRNRAGVGKEINDSIVDLNESSGKLAVLFVDLNKFKQFNDALGHDAGDAILKETAERLGNAVRSDDVVFRYGGDEFIVVINNIVDVRHVENVVKNIMQKFEPPVMFGGKSIEISLSIGVAIAPDDTANGEEMLKFSDVAMYAAKRDKTCSHRFFDRSMLRRSGDNTSEDSTA
ncbi:MAG TPA: diguanylate cyclase [Porticoccus sp.]|nr:diguanylate cyclase [Porticoccus sp.]